MAVPPPDSSYTPPHTPLIEESPFISDSMEDLDPQATRKRPRLDSGSRVSPTLSLDGTSRTASIAPASDMDEASDSGNPANKVTINTKSPPSTMDPSLPPSNPELSGSDLELLPNPDTVPNPISVSSSPSSPRSPEIEVAEPEDINQVPNTSNWKSLGQVVRDQDEPEVIEIQDVVPLSESFPKVHIEMTPRENFKALGDMLENGNKRLRSTRLDQILIQQVGHLREGTALITIKEWLHTCVGDLDRLTIEEFAADIDFWEYLPSVLDRLLRRQHDLQLDGIDDPSSFFEQYFLDYSCIVLHLVRLDTALLSAVDEDAEDVEMPPSTCRRYLHSFPWMLHGDQIPFFRVLENQSRTGTRNLSARLKAQISAPPFDAPGVLMQYTSHLLALLPKCPQIVTILPAPLVNMLAFFECDTERNQNGGSDSPIDLLVDSTTLQPFYEAVRRIDKVYRTFVEKKSQLATSELSDSLLNPIFRSYRFLCFGYPEFLLQLGQELSIKVPEDADTEQAAFCVIWTWKFDTLKKQIMEGRMELRVHGVEMMQSDLVSIWSQNVSQNRDRIESPFLKYLVEYLREIKILDYLVGIDSHPQLISRSSNIFGFLIVTGKYTDHDTDVIWKTVTESQDDRTVCEVISMLARTFAMHLSRSKALLYVCSKLLEFPLDRFDSRIIDFCEQLVPRMRERQQDRDRDYRNMSGEEHVDSIPLKLCIRLIRESSGAKDLPLEQKELMQGFGSEQLGQFIKAGLNETDMAETYERCIQDIGEMNECTAGSIQVLNALVPRDDARELWKLATDFDLTRLVIIELHHLVSEDHAKLQDPSFKHDFASRVEILRRLIDLAPDTITPDLGKTLWEEIFMSENLAPEERQTIWKMMVDLTNRTTKENQFLELCIHEYLPDVLPKDYSREVLWFAQQSVHYEIRIKSPPIVGENEVISIPGMDRIWNFILTAPPQSIEAEAIKFAIDSYLDHGIVRRSPRSAIDATHIALVNRCVDQLKSAAIALKPSCHGTTNGDVSMDIDNSNAAVGTDELIFSRSLLFLRQLLHGLRTRPQYSSPRGSPPTLPERPLKGEPIEFRYQCFNGAGIPKICSKRIGSLSTAAELVEMLVQLSRFSKFTTILGGQKVELLQDPEALVKNLKLSSGLLIIRKAPDAHEITWAGSRQSFTAVDNEVLKHFDELYDMLDLKDDLARQIIDFLVVFPPQARALELVRSNSNTEKDMFPLQRPFKALYSLNTLSMCLHEEAAEMSPDQDFVSHSNRVLVAFLTSEELFSSLSGNPITIVLATRAIECLLLAISVYRPTDDESVLISDPMSLVQRVLELLEIGRTGPTDPPAGTCAQSLVCNSFAVLVEGSLRDINVWKAVKQHAQFDGLILSLLLEEKRKPIRTDILERLKIICGPLKPFKLSMQKLDTESPAAENPNRIDMLATLWSSFLQVIPKTLEHVPQSEEFFNAALWMFRVVAQKSPRDLIFNEYLQQWSAVMLTHQTEEFVGREPADNLIIGLSALLEWCLELANAAGVTLDTLNIAEDIFNQYLFPDFSPDTVEHAVPQVPVMHSYTRSSLYNVVNLLCKQSDETYCQVLELLNTNVPRDSPYLEYGYNRSLMLRSPEGYAGLKNFSNTCYLNSLVTQLFMNIEFRDFILNLPIADQMSQKLLYETQRLFTWMQETWSKSIEPADFVKSILTYDNEEIDVTVQMDVDEFYNLLFDRWEAQVLDPEKKKKFRSFYGGQLVQQIKSMECDHISERLEPFSAIQCEIKGKATLEDSLRAYVAGEVMQGDNKYSCTSCGRHVDAVKRACLKDVPDNLIFHLKRFDFDMVHMLRSKINDEFQFPHHIDMTPYTVEHLSDPEQTIAPDIFELVGVLVHTGTAESGHYYSYTLERPSSGGEANWVEFNDSDVSKFDPSTIASQCFGGPSDTMQFMNGAPKIKPWNAYMLFYQRVSTIEKSKEIFKPTKPDIPIHLPVSISTQNYIAMDNEMLIRIYCLLDPQYAYFVGRLLQRWPEMGAENVNKIRAESLAINVGMDTIEQLVTRTKYSQGHQEVYGELVDMINKSPNAAQSVLEWVINRPTSMYNLMMKPQSADLRNKGLLLINYSLKHLHLMSTSQDLNEDERISWRDRFDEAIQQIVPMMAGLWTEVQSAFRVWDDYFGFLLKLCTYGPEIIHVLLENGHFAACLEILWIDEDDSKKLRIRYPNYVRLLSKGRRFNHLILLSLCLVFFKHVDLSLRPTPIGGQRRFLNGKFSASVREMELIRPTEPDGSLSILLKLLKHETLARNQTTRAIIGVLLDGEPDAGLLTPIQTTLENGVRLEPAVQCTPFLEAATTFCQRCPDKGIVLGMIDFIAKGIDSIDNSGGQEHMDFFMCLCRSTNERLNMDFADFTEPVLDHIPVWAPTLLIDKDESVRRNMQNILEGMVFNDNTVEGNTEDTEQNGERQTTITRERRHNICRRLPNACLERLKSAFLADRISHIDARLLENITPVINYCLATFYDDSETDQQEVQQANELLSLLKSMSLEEVPDDAPSESDVASVEEWDANSVIASDSEMGVAGSP
ncbi:Peptidase C19, ubiquitin carboxyl-terminal hydrolase 2 [Penicillium camemberti]|uniref:Peptidase C19, ubiquitin carboxyl-terminal hydrolase 2 n=1 Tax=Penicillium camemberti (strain FM 013) TaxID=1429867 RepID=A0A0G4PG00_PENC3|nr:Peptidase C19, ubiquitin carboxyl-terminal hydrolase 2 [Penicillium camemberti]